MGIALGNGVGVSYGLLVPVSYLLRDEFVTTEASPLASPRTAEPGPGTLTLVETDGELSIAVEKLYFTAQVTPLWGDLGLYSASGLARAAGRALVGVLYLSTWEECGLGWHSAAAVADPGGFPHAIQANTINGRLDTEADLSLIIGLPASTDTPVAVILRSSGAHYLYNDGSAWHLLWVDKSEATATLYPVFSVLDGEGILDNLRVVDLDSPWDTDYGPATEHVAGNVSAGQAFDHDADFLLEFDHDTLTAGGSIEIRFRVQDADNYWYLTLPSNGNMQLWEKVATVPTLRGGAGAGTLTGGERIVLMAIGEEIRGYYDGTVAWTYASAANFKTETSGSVANLGTTGAISDLAVWPRTLSGAALNALERV